jgi:NAD(P)-dependent dehydrogenase (short-subunit alcohol dehydrogenase family)
MISHPAIYPSLADKSVVVTGGATGIGADIVRTFAAQGAKVAIIDIDKASGKALCEELAGGAHHPMFVAADLLEVEAFDTIVADIAAAQGAPTILVNNAANDRRQQIGSVKREDWDWSFAINLRHFFFMAQAVAPGMQAQRDGVIINLTSINALNGSPDLPAYSAAKGAVITLTKTLARKFGDFNIRCNAVAPGAVVTPRQKQLWISDEKEADFIRRQQLHEPMTTQAIADAVVFLCSDQARLITKQVLVVDAGLSG